MRSPFNSPHRSSSRLSFRFGSTVIILLVTFFFIFLLFFDQLRPLPCPHSLVAKLPGTFQQESLFLFLFFYFSTKASECRCPFLPSPSPPPADSGLRLSSARVPSFVHTQNSDTFKRPKSSRPRLFATSLSCTGSSLASERAGVIEKLLPPGGEAREKQERDRVIQRE